MVKAKKNLKVWAKKAWKDVKKDPSIIGKQIDKMKIRGHNIAGKAQDTYGKGQSGDVLGFIKGAHSTYRATVGGKKDDQWLKSNKDYRRATNVGTKTYKAAEAFNSGDHEGGYKHAMDAARAAIGKAKVQELQATKAGKHALAAQGAYLAAKKAHSGGAGRGDSAMAGINAYAAKRAQQTQRRPIA